MASEYCSDDQRIIATQGMYLASFFNSVDDRNGIWKRVALGGPMMAPTGRKLGVIVADCSTSEACPRPRSPRRGKSSVSIDKSRWSGVFVGGLLDPGRLHWRGGRAASDELKIQGNSGARSEDEFYPVCVHAHLMSLQQYHRAIG